MENLLKLCSPKSNKDNKNYQLKTDKNEYQTFYFDVCHYVPQSGIKIGEKKNIRYAFERFPKMDEYIKNDAFDLKKFKDSPLDLLKTLEKKMK